ncbi:MAG: hypothetical protein RLZZ618_3220 [Pseudomonadota bacterium]
MSTLPLQATVITRAQLDNVNAAQLSDVIKLEAAATDAYNAYGYYDYFTIRGFVTDPRFNFRREGLPNSAETPLSLVNKERVEILKGTSGIQAGTSAPGGLINLVVKRPTANRLRSVRISTGDRGSLGASLDWSDHADADKRIGYRVNLARERVNPNVDHYGHLDRSLAAFAGDWRITNDTLLQAELEWSHQVGASVPGYSLTGDRLPDVRRPANLNNQPWSQPNQFDGLTGTLRADHTLSGGWHWITVAGTQRLKTDDYLAYPYGHDCHPTSGFTSCDRYAANGDFDLYDYRSENERRTVDSAESALQGRWKTGSIEHSLRGGLSLSRLRYDIQRQTNQYVGSGNIDGTLVTPANPAVNDEATSRRERTTELFLTDHIDWGQGFSSWLGLRHTRIHRESVRTDGSRATSYDQPITTPWIAGAYEWKPSQFVYASWGQGAESDVVPNRSRYTNAGLALPVLRSRQWELGAKGSHERTDWSLAYFDIDRPAVTDAPPLYEVDGSNHHRGLDGSINHRMNQWNVSVGAMLLHARREGAADATLNGRRPTNVPQRTLKLQTGYRVAELPGLTLQGALTHEGRRTVLADESMDLPSWTRTDLGAIYRHRLDAADLTWRLSVDNVFDRRAWKESPTQYGHVYLFPLEARTVRLSLRADL